MLAAAACPEPAREAALLVADVLDQPAVSGDAQLSDEAVAAVRRAVERRAQREPLGYIRGRVAFRGLEITVDPRVFIPRPDTEVLVEAALALPAGLSVLEPCTGSGAIALALKHERPDLAVTASDASAAALAVAAANAERLRIDVAFEHAEGIAGVAGGPFDAVVANPPYVPAEQLGQNFLPPELEHHEPRTAFDGGDDGLELYRRFIPQLVGVRHALFEVGDGQAEPVADMLRGVGFDRLGTRRAPSGAVRVVTGERSGS
jgi:release factor glutamine methyltransferase